MFPKHHCVDPSLRLVALALAILRAKRYNRAAIALKRSTDNAGCLK
jgi:hypothetical protein